MTMLKDAKPIAFQHEIEWCRGVGMLDWIRWLNDMTTERFEDFLSRDSFIWKEDFNGTLHGAVRGF